MDPKEKAQELEAVARFLLDEVRPALRNPAQRFRVSVAAQMAQLVASEIRGSGAGGPESLDRLQKLLPDVPIPDAEGGDALGALNRILCERIRNGHFDGPARERLLDHLRAETIAKLKAVNPRFDVEAKVP